MAQLIESVGDPSQEAWIAVEFEGDSTLPRNFLLGDGGRSRNNFINRPLRSTLSYRVFVHALGRDSVNQLVGLVYLVHYRTYLFYFILFNNPHNQ